MSFYEALGRYYDSIFPLQQATLVFLIQKLGKADQKQILDLACGTGTYALALAARGYNVTGLDLDETMIRLAREKKGQRRKSACEEGGEVSFLQGDMLELSKYLQPGYDGAFCIGNSLVHMETLKEIEIAVKEIAAVLRAGAALIVQTVNYDRVLSKNIKALPPLENRERGVSFERLYNYDQENHRILFTGILKLSDGSSRTHTVPLYPLKQRELEGILARTGFGQREFYGSFNGEPWSAGDSPATLAVAFLESLEPRARA